MLLMALMTQIFLLCYFGNDLIIKSDELPMHLFLSNWPVLMRDNKPLKMVYMVFREQLKRRSQVLVMLLFPFSLETFTKV